MAINLDQVRQDESAELGNVTIGTSFSGDVSGTQGTGITVTGFRGVNLDNTGAAQNNEAYVRLTDGADFSRERVVLFNEDTTSGSVQGNYDNGLDLINIYNATINTTPATFAAVGEGLVYDGSDFFEVRQLNSTVHTVVTAATHTAVKNEKIFIDSTANTVVVNPPTTPAPSEGDNFYVYAVLGTNEVTVNSVVPIVRAPVFGLLCVFISNSWQSLSIASPAIPSP